MTRHVSCSLGGRLTCACETSLKTTLLAACVWGGGRGIPLILQYNYVPRDMVRWVEQFQ